MTPLWRVKVKSIRSNEERFRWKEAKAPAKGLPLDLEWSVRARCDQAEMLIRLRKANPVIVYGSYELLLLDHPQIYAFTRTLGDQRLLVTLNFSSEAPIFSPPEEIDRAGAELLIANYPVEAAAPLVDIAVRPYEARVYRLR